MSMIYAMLIIKGKKTYEQVPDSLKEEVENILEDLECGYLIKSNK